MKIQRAATLVFSIAVIILATGCASITGTRNQPVSVTTSNNGKPVLGVDCNLINDKGQWYVTTPGSVMIQKGYGDLAINCKKELMVGTSVFKSTNEGAVWGNILAGGLIGYAVDAGSGAGFSYPQTMNVEVSQRETKETAAAVEVAKEPAPDKN